MNNINIEFADSKNEQEKTVSDISEAIHQMVLEELQKKRCHGGLFSREGKIYHKPPWTPPVLTEDLGRYKKRKESVVNSFLDSLIYFPEGFRQT